MNVRITCRKIEIEEELKPYAQKKIGALAKYFKKVDGAHVIFSEDRGRVNCEIGVHAPPLDVVASLQEAEPRAAFDKTLKMVEAQIRKQKSRFLESKKPANVRDPRASKRASAPSRDDGDDE